MSKIQPVEPVEQSRRRFSRARGLLRCAVGLAGGRTLAAATLVTALAVLLGSAPALAFDRLFPPIAKRGTLSMEDYPVVSMNGKQRQLSAGAWIRNENNTIDMPNSLRGRRFTVNYTENGMGEIDRVWILTAAEAERELPKTPQAGQLPEQ